MIHKYKQNELNIVLDVNSGSVHIVDDVVYDLLGEKEIDMTAADSYEKNIVDEALAEINELIADESLYATDEYGDIGKYAVAGPIKAMCLHIAHDCNLRCKYCFASTGDFGGGRSLMPFETGKAAIDFLMKRSLGRHNLEVDFFGGEPLMNWGVVKQIVEYGREQEKIYDKNIRFTITTNGMGLTPEIEEYINKEMSNVVLSIDGRKSVNDKMRPMINGNGSYDTIVPKFKSLVSKRGDKDYYVRGTFTGDNIDFAQDVLHLNDLGFDQVSVEPCVCDPSMSYALTEDKMDAIGNEYENLATEMIKRKKEGRGFNFFHFMIDLEQGPCVIKRLRGCGAGNEYCAVTPDGDIFPCHQFVGIDEYKLGDVFSDNLNEDMRKSFAGASVYSKEDCKDCWAKFYCSGGCNANNKIYMGDIMKPHTMSCLLEKKRVECAIAIKAVEAMED